MLLVLTVALVMVAATIALTASSALAALNPYDSCDHPFRSQEPDVAQGCANSDVSGGGSIDHGPPFTGS
jgi:hypothetical protein